MVKAIIFDLDGTLLDTSRDIRKVLNKTLEEFSYSALPLEKVIKIIGGGSKKLIENALSSHPEKVEEVHSVFCKYYAENDNSLTSLYEGEAKALKNFSSAKIKLAILTNKPNAATRAVYAKFLSNFGFCEVLGQTEYYPVKPNPASTFAILDKMGVSPCDCLFVGDGEADVLTALNAGIKCVSALWGYRTKEELEKVGARVFAHNFAELEKIVFG